MGMLDLRTPQFLVPGFKPAIIFPGVVSLSRKQFISPQAMRAVQAPTAPETLSRQILFPLVKAIRSPLPIAIGLSFALARVVPWMIASWLSRKSLGLPPRRDDLINRRRAASNLLKTITERSSCFFFLYGGPGIGRSTLVCDALRARGSGSIYILFEEGVDVSLERLAEKIHLATGCLLAFNVFTMNVAGLSFEHRFEELFKLHGPMHEIGQHYKRLTGQELLLVLDIGEGSLPDNILRSLSELVDASALKLVIVGGQLPLVRSSDSALPIASPLKIPPIPEEHLKCNVGGSCEDVSSRGLGLLVNLFGGKIEHMNWCISRLSEGVPLEYVEAEYGSEFTHTLFASSGLIDVENRGWAPELLRRMLDGGSMHAREFQQMVPRDEIRRMIRGSGSGSGSVFTVDEHKVVRFECKANEEYAREWLSSFEGRSLRG